MKADLVLAIVLRLCSKSKPGQTEEVGRRFALSCWPNPTISSIPPAQPDNNPPCQTAIRKEGFPCCSKRPFTSTFLPHVRRAEATPHCTITNGTWRACGDSPRGRRDAGLVALLLDSGLRAKEICSLQLADVYLERHSFAVRVKGGDERIGYFGHACCKHLQAWIDVRQPHPGVSTLFVSVGGNTPGQPLTTGGLWAALRRLGKRAGISKVSPHAFRRAFATLMTRNGAPTKVVQLAGRWGHIGMVELYTQALDGSAVYAQFSPLDRLYD